MARRLTLWGWLAAGFAALAVAAPNERLVIATAQGPVVLQVALADTPSERRQGLQGRRQLGLREGMLFDFQRVEPVQMWMHRTPLSLDMLFVAADGTVVGIVAATEPGSRRLIPSPGPVRAVLEVAAGSAASWGVQVGDRLRHPIFSAVEAP